MRRSVRRATAMAGSGLLLPLLLAGTGSGVRAQDPDECPSDRTVEKICVTGTVRSRALPVTTAPLGDGEWFTVTDPPDDVRTSAGDVVVDPDADIVQAWWRVGRLDQPLIGYLEENDGIEANDFQLGARTQFLEVVLQVAGETVGPEPEERTLLIGVATDANGRPGDDGAASVAEPFSFWHGIDTIHQAGQFSTGTFGAGSTSLNEQGDFTEYYNIGSGIRLDVFPETQSYHLLVPVEGMGNPFRVLTQSAEDGVAHQDLLGDPEHANGLLLIDGVRSAGSSCVELFQTAVRGEDTPPALVQLRVSGVPPNEPFRLEGDLIQGEERTHLNIDADSGEDGLVFDVPLRATGEFRLGDVLISSLAGGTDPVLNPVLTASLLDPFTVGDPTTAGHLLGGLNCARDRWWTLTTDACLPLAPRSFDSWDPDLRFQLDEEVAAALGTTEATLLGSGDDEFSTCAAYGVDGQPVAAYTVARHRVTVEEAREFVLPGLEREGCTIEEVVDERFDLAATRDCVGDPATLGLFTVSDEHSVFAQVPRTNAFFPGGLSDTIPRFHLVDSDYDGISDAEDDDIDGDGIPDDDDPDSDNDEVPDTQDRFPLNSHKA